MAAADLFIGKPGGLSCTEALTMHLSVVVYNPIAGQEEKNTVYLEENKVAFRARDHHDLESVLNQLAREWRPDPSYPGFIPPGSDRDKMRKEAMPDPTQTIARAIMANSSSSNAGKG
jgi:UDP-N-acetylglucosamine:LPS N-acetylglucosamine transferase